MSGIRKLRPQKTARQRLAERAARDQAECDAVTEDALRDYSQVELSPPPRSPLKGLRLRVVPLRRTESDPERLRKVFSVDTDWREPDLELRGWEEIASFLGLNERTLRAAYKNDPFVRRWIHRRGGGYRADPSDIFAHLMPHLELRRAQAQRASAQAQPRGKRGRFSTSLTDN